MLDVLEFKGAMAKGVLDRGEDTIFIGEDQFKKFMESVENLVPRETTTETVEPQENESEEETIKYELPDEILVDTPEGATTFMGDDDVKEANQEPVNGVSVNPPAQELLQNGINFFAQLGKTLKSPEATRELIDSITQKDESGKVYLKIPVENEEVINNAVQVLSTLFGAFTKQ